MRATYQLRWAATFAAAAMFTYGDWALAQTFAPATSQHSGSNPSNRPSYFAPTAHTSWASYTPDQPTEEVAPGSASAVPHHDPYMGLSPSHDGAAHGADCFDDSLSSFCAPCEARSGWFGSAGGLAMTRDQDNFLPFSYATGDESVQLVTNRDADFNVAGGVETRLGRYFCCGQASLEFVFWTLIPGTQDYQVLGADVSGDLNGIYNWNSLDYNGSTANNFVDNAVVHRIKRDFEFQNYEINWNNHLTLANCSNFQVQTIAGFRVFRFGETLDFGADTVDAVFTGAADEIHYNIEVDNRLYGFQLGGSTDYQFAPRWSLTTKLLAGIFANDVQHHSRIGGSAGDAFVNNGPNNGQVFNVSGGRTNLALMGELNLGLTFRPTRNWQFGAGYRAMGVNGIALASNQLYHDLRGIEDVEQIEVNGDLILQGGYFQASYNY